VLGQQSSISIFCKGLAGNKKIIAFYRLIAHTHLSSAPQETLFTSKTSVHLEESKKLADYGALLKILVQLVHQNLHLHSIGECVDLHGKGDALEVLLLAVHKAKKMKTNISTTRIHE